MLRFIIAVLILLPASVMADTPSAPAQADPCAVYQSVAQHYTACQQRQRYLQALADKEAQRQAQEKALQEKQAAEAAAEAERQANAPPEFVTDEQLKAYIKKHGCPPKLRTQTINPIKLERILRQRGCRRDE